LHGAQLLVHNLEIFMFALHTATRSLPKVLAALFTTAALTAAAAGHGAKPEATAGVYLAGPNGMSLYTFNPDPVNGGKSVCNDQCAVNWPPLPAATVAAGGDWTHIRRDDGTMQLAYKGKPLYYWIRDAKPGDRTGDGVNNVWHLARP
jgi:predicted lipoprotein with Yx(FWY)xxD motif